MPAVEPCCCVNIVDTVASTSAWLWLMCSPDVSVTLSSDEKYSCKSREFAQHVMNSPLSKLPSPSLS